MNVKLTVIVDDSYSDDASYYPAVKGIFDFLYDQAPRSVEMEMLSATQTTPLETILIDQRIAIANGPQNRHFVALFLLEVPISRNLVNEIEMIHGQLENQLKIFCTNLPDNGYPMLQTRLRDHSDRPKVVLEIDTLDRTMVDKINQSLLKRLERAVDTAQTVSGMSFSRRTDSDEGYGDVTRVSANRDADDDDDDYADETVYGDAPQASGFRADDGHADVTRVAEMRPGDDCAGGCMDDPADGDDHTDITPVAGMRDDDDYFNNKDDDHADFARAAEMQANDDYADSFSNDPADQNRDDPDSGRFEPLAAHQDQDPEIMPAEPVDATPNPWLPHSKSTIRRASVVSNKQQVQLENEGFIKPVVFNYRPVPPKEEDPYYYPENALPKVVRGITDQSGASWIMVGASVRGRGHQHKGTPRDDAFEIVAAGNWHIMVLSDGAGSAPYSRVTANESVTVAAQTIAREALPVTEDVAQIEPRMKTALQKAIRKVYETQEAWNRKLKVDKSKTYCTMLMLIHQPLANGGCVIGTLHVGDGLICGASNETFNLLTQGDHGADASTTHFVLSFPVNKLVARAQTYYIEADVNISALMSDGIEDDLKPSTEQFRRGERIEDNAKRFVRILQEDYFAYPIADHWGEILEDLISYERANSNDDRTLIVLTRQAAPQT